MEYLVHIAILAVIYGILGIGLNLVVGFTGLLSVTHAAFFGIGAYATGILLTNRIADFWGSLGLGMFGAAILAFVIGLVLSRFRDDYYALASFGFNTIVFALFLNLQDITRGPLGIPGISRPEIFGYSFGENSAFLILALVFLVAIYFFSKWLTESSFGRVLKAVREDERAAQVFGYDTFYFKLAIFSTGAALAAVAGSLFASYITFIDPSTFTLHESMFILAVIILGGLASLRGSVIGAVALILLPEILRFVGFPAEIAAQMRQVAYGLVLVLLMLYRPQGLFGEYKF
jgi:branched-chain amino acid transport system permease protein